MIYAIWSAPSIRYVINYATDWITEHSERIAEVQLKSMPIVVIDKEGNRIEFMPRYMKPQWEVGKHEHIDYECLESAECFSNQHTEI